MALSFLTPLAALVGLAVVLPLAAARLRERRAERVRLALALGRPPARGRRLAATALVALFALVGVSAAQPVLRLEEPLVARGDAEAYFLFDVSRSMLAAAGPSAPTRFERAIALGLRLREELPDVPLGVASITDRPISHLFPTSDRAAFTGVVRRALGVERPPPSEGERRLATDLGSLGALARDNYFSPGSLRRLVVLLSDGETRPIAVEGLAARLERANVGLVVTRLWSASERIYDAGGRIDPDYRPSRASEQDLAALAGRSVGGRVFGEAEVAAAASAARGFLGDGPAVEVGTSERAVPLAAYVLLAASVPLVFLLARR